MALKLYSYFRSSCSYRVRIALNLKGLDYETIPIHLVKNGGEQYSQSFHQLNPSHKVPVLVHEGRAISHSVAIIEYLEETFPEKNLFPKAPIERALVRQLCEIINSEIQPLQNLSVLQAVVNEYSFSDEQKLKWIKHWISLGFQSFEELLAKTTGGNFCFGETPTAADCFLLPQVYNAKRFNVDMGLFPKINTIAEFCENIEAFKGAHPNNQPDTPQ